METVGTPKQLEEVAEQWFKNTRPATSRAGFSAKDFARERWVINTEDVLVAARDLGWTIIPPPAPEPTYTIRLTEDQRADVMTCLFRYGTRNDMWIEKSLMAIHDILSVATPDPEPELHPTIPITLSDEARNALIESVARAVVRAHHMGADLEYAIIQLETLLRMTDEGGDAERQDS